MYLTTQENEKEFDDLKRSIRLQKYQYKRLNQINQKIEQLEEELYGGKIQKKKNRKENV